MISGFTVKWTVGGDEAGGEDVLQELAFAFERAGDNVADIGRFVFPLLVPVFEAHVSAQFDSEGGGPIAAAWPQLSERYEAWKSANFPGMPLLQLTGSLRDALTSSDSVFARREISNNSFDFGTVNVPYASFHQSGTSFMPARPPFDFGDDFESDVRAAATEGVREAMLASGADRYIGEDE